MLIALIVGIVTYAFVYFLKPCVVMQVQPDRFSRVCVSEYNYKVDKICMYYNESDYSMDYEIIPKTIP